MENDLVSCIITTHNRIEDLKKAISSVEAQTYPKLELIVVNDNSTDGTESFLKQLKLEIPLTVINNRISKGGNHARNLGIKSSKGSYLAFLDDDDQWKKQKIEKQLSKFDEDPSIGLVYCGSDTVIDNKISIEKLPKNDFKGDLSQKVFSNIFTQTSCIMIKKDVLINCGDFDENLSFWQEYEFIIRIAQFYNVDFINESLVKIFVNKKDPGRLSNKIDKWSNSVNYIDRKHAKLIETLPEEIKISKLALFYNDAANRYAVQKNRKMQRKYLYKSYKCKKNLMTLISVLFNLDYERKLRLKKIISFK